MRKYLSLILALTALMAAVASTQARDIRRVMADKTMTAVTPTATSYIMASYSTATGWDLRRMADTSVIKLGGIDSTTADGMRRVQCNNTGDLNTAGLTADDAGAFCFNKTTGSFRYWTGTTVSDWTSSAAPEPIAMSDLTDWPQAVVAAEVSHLDGATSNLQAQINALSAQVADLVASMGEAGIDTVPDSFSFTSQTDVALSTTVYSDTVQINGITAPASISVTGGEYKIDSGAWTAVSGTIGDGQWVSARHTSAATNSTATTTTVTVGGMARNFTTTTLAATTPVMYASQPTMSSGINVNDHTAHWGIGAIVDAAGTHNVRKLRVYVRSVANGGALPSKNFKARLYNLNGTALNTILAESTNTVTGITGAGFIEFTFASTAFTQGNAWVVYSTDALDTANYISLGYIGADSDSGYSHYAYWNNVGGLAAQDTTRDMRFELYE